MLFKLVSAGKKVKALKRKSSNLNQVLKTFSYYTEEPKSLYEKIEWIEGDILDYFSLEKILNGVQEIYHCAAIISFQTRDKQKMIANNVQGSANLVNAAIENGVKKLCHVSSVSALGHLENGELITEETNWVPGNNVSGYSESKFFSEVEIWRGIEEGLDAVIVNPSIIFGPAKWDTGSAKMFHSIYNGLKFYTKGTTGFVDVDDVSEIMIQLMDPSNFERCKNQRYLLNGENLSYKNVFSSIAKVLEKPEPSIYASDFLLGIVWRLTTFASRIMGQDSMITKDAVSNSNKTNNFDGRKITRMLDYTYMPISESIEKTAGFLKKEYQ